MTKPSQRRRYPWEQQASNTLAAPADSIRTPSLVADIPRVALSLRETAMALGISLATLNALRRNGDAPPEFAIAGGKRILVPVNSLVKWAADRAGAEDPADVQSEP